MFQALLEEKSDLTNQLKMAKIILQKNPHPEVQDLGARLVARLRLQLRTCQDLLTLEYKARPR